MNNYSSTPGSLEQELAEKASRLAAQRPKRERQLVDLTLTSIASGVVSHESEILRLMADNKGHSLSAVRETVVRELTAAAEGRLWCPEYVERLRSDQPVMCYTGSHWQMVKPQQWKDFVSLCAAKCGVDESLRMNTTFMKLLFEGVAFNLASNRHQAIPADEVWLNMSNGTLVICSNGSVSLREHCKADLFRYTLPYSYDPQAECPRWQQFLDRVLPSADAQLLLAEYIGYSLMADHSLEKMLLLYGEGLNGKSVTLDVIEALLGSVNVSYLSLSDLTNDDVKRAGIEHKMLNISHESGKDLNPNVLKQLTSGEPVMIKNLYRDPRETTDYGKLIAAFNILPRAENSFGFFRRLLILPYQVTIPKQEIDRRLSAKLKEELPGILCWVLRVLPGLMSRREFSACDISDQALEQYRLQSDNVRLFLSEACNPSEVPTPAADLYKSYRSYCQTASLRPLGKIKFIERLEALGHDPVVNSRMKSFKLVALES